MDKVKMGFPIEYEDENNIVRNGLFLREPEIKELEKRLKEINKITDLKQQCKKQKEVISRAVKYIDDLRDESAERQGFYNCFPDDLFIPDINELLDILKEVSE